MNRPSVRICIAALLLVVGVGLGFLLARQFPATSSTADDSPRIRFRPGDEQVFTDPPKRTEWQYPGSKIINSSDGAEFTDMGAIKFSTSQRTVLSTPDDFDTVCEFYKKKLDLRHPGDGSVLWKYEGGGTSKDYYLTIYETKHGNWFEGSPQQGAKSMGFHLDTVRYHLVGFLSRGRGDTETQVMLAYRPLTEFISVAKQHRVK